MAMVEKRASQKFVVDSRMIAARKFRGYENWALAFDAECSKSRAVKERLVQLASMSRVPVCGPCPALVSTLEKFLRCFLPACTLLSPNTRSSKLGIDVDF